MAKISNVTKELERILARCLSDIKVECDEEFDRNFERKAFFSDKWQRRGGAYHEDKPLLIDTGQLRKSVSSQIVDNKLIYTSTLEYAGYHNDGATITVSKRMKGYFWHKYYEVSGGFTRKKNGEQRNDKKNRALTTEAEFYKAMALMRVGRKIIIPRRRFVGWHPNLESSVRQIIEENLSQYFNSDEFQISIKK